MRRRRRRRMGSPASFFSFQDILMCCFGVFMLDSVVLSLMLARAPAAVAAEAARASPTAQAARSRQERKDALAGRKAELQKQGNQDLAGEVSVLRAEVERLRSEYATAVERISGLVKEAVARRSGATADPDLGRLAELTLRRDALALELQGLEGRRQITFLVRPGARPTRVIEIAGDRVVSCLATGNAGASGAPVHDLESGLRVLKAVVDNAVAKHEHCLFAVKPSGVDLYGAMLQRLRPKIPPDHGLELIPEDRGVSDLVPVVLEPTRG